MLDNHFDSSFCAEDYIIFPTSSDVPSQENNCESISKASTNHNHNTYASVCVKGLVETPVFECSDSRDLSKHFPASTCRKCSNNTPEELSTPYDDAHAFETNSVSHTLVMHDAEIGRKGSREVSYLISGNNDNDRYESSLKSSSIPSKRTIDSISECRLTTSSCSTPHCCSLEASETVNSHNKRLCQCEETPKASKSLHRSRQCIADPVHTQIEQHEMPQESPASVSQNQLLNMATIEGDIQQEYEESVLSDCTVSSSFSINDGQSTDAPARITDSRFNQDEPSPELEISRSRVKSSISRAASPSDDEYYPDSPYTADIDILERSEPRSGHAKKASATKWTPQDHHVLLNARAKSISWQTVANTLGRSKRACQLKFAQISQNSLILTDPDVLTKLMNQYKARKHRFWSGIAKEIGCEPSMAERTVLVQLSKAK